MITSPALPAAFAAWRAIAATDLEPDDARGPALLTAEQAAMDAVAASRDRNWLAMLAQVALLARLATSPDDCRFRQVADAILATGMILGVHDATSAIVEEIEGVAGLVADLQAP